MQKLFLNHCLETQKTYLIMKALITRRMTLLMSMVLVTLLAFGQQKGDMAIGGGLVYGLDDYNNLGITGKFQWNITDGFRLEPSASYYLEKDFVEMWDMNVNLHYIFKLTEKFNLYPLGGITLLGVSIGNFSDEKFGANLGGGAEFKITDCFSIGAEIKYQFVSDVDRAVFGVGVTYRF